MRRPEANGVGVTTACGDVAPFLTARVTRQVDGRRLPAGLTLIVGLCRLGVGTDQFGFGANAVLVGTRKLLSADQGICPGTVFVRPTRRLGTAARPCRPLVGLSSSFCRRRRNVEVTTAAQRPPLTTAPIGRVSLPLEGR